MAEQTSSASNQAVSSLSASMAEIIIPAPLKFLMTNLKSIVHNQLTADNYAIWRMQIYKLFAANGFEKYLTGEETCPVPTPDIDNLTEIKLWNLIDQNLLSALLSTISPSILPYILNLTSATAVWRTLEQRLQPTNRSRVIQLKNDLHNIQMRDNSMMQYLSQIRTIVDNIAAAGANVDVEDIILYILRGLPPAYDAFTTTIRSSLHLISLDTLYSLLCSEEVHINTQRTRASQLSADTTALYTGRAPAKGRGNYRGRNRGIISSPTAAQSSYPRPPRPICQICNKPGHIAANCWHRSNLQYTPTPAATPRALFGTSTPTSSEWVLDSGASSHLTADAANLTNYTPYNGADSVSIANGTNLPIQHSGKGLLPLPDTPRMQIVPRTSKRKLSKEALDENPTPENETQKFGGAVKRQNISQTCIHEVAFPDDFKSSNDGSSHGTLENPIYDGKKAKTYPFELDPFQQVSIACLERKESILVSAHTSAGKTAVAEYAIAMSFRDKQRVIYTSPLKALSNQKYREFNQEFFDVGLMTGDVTLSSHSHCLVMTTEILRGMLYKGAELLKDVAWVIFDEIHYMKDRERGVVWEESIIFLPPAIKMVFLSATLSNATEFAEWICKLRKQPCHVVYTDFRPTPLYHYAFPVGGSHLYLVVDEDEHFKEDYFAKLQETFTKKKSQVYGHRNRKASSRIAKGGTASSGSDIDNIMKIILEQKLEPVIFFSFSRWECEQHAMSMLKHDFNSAEEKDIVEHVFKNAILCLSEEERNLPAIRLMLPPFQRGIAVHHSGLLPIIKELVELLFQEGLIKALFATETFAMGLNMPAKTVVFTSLRKWDGVRHRYIGSGEYIQMSGRAGRRGKDEHGICIIMIDKKMEMDVLKDMVLGKPAPLVSTFRFSYYSILNLLSRAEGQFTAEHVINNSFHQFQYEKSWPDMNKKISKLETEVAMLESSGETELADYHNLGLEIAQLERKIMSEITRPERILRYFVPGRLVKVRDCGSDWDWGLVNLVKEPPSGAGSLPPALAASRGGSYVVDTFLLYSLGSSDNGSCQKPFPPCPEERVEMHVVPVPLHLISGISDIKISLRPEWPPAEDRQRTLLILQELHNEYPRGFSRLNPVKGIRINDPELTELVHKFGELEHKLAAHPLHELQKFRDELKNRSRVLKRLGHIDADSVVQLKGRAARLIDTGDELLVTELMFNGTFNDLDPHQVVALASCFIPGDKSSDQVFSRVDLAKPLQKLQETARKIAEIQRECELDINVEKYVESAVTPYLMDVFYCWSKGATFAEVIEMTDIFEGSIIRLARRLDVFLNQLKAAAHAVGDINLEKKFESGTESLRRGLMFTNSLYL